MIVFTHTEKGRREYQQDRFIVNDKIFVVCDGMGGHSNGELAAESGIKAFTDSSKFKDDPQEEMVMAIKKADLECKESGDDRGSTLSAAIIDENNKVISIAHVGDSRMYIINEDKVIKQITVDHVTSYGALTSGLGFVSDIFAGKASYKTGHYLVLVTDGVYGPYRKRLPNYPYEYIDHNYHIIKQIFAAINNKENPAERLCIEAINNGSTDNCTAIVVSL